MMNAFVYCWTDYGNKKLYVGVHKGTQDDKYVCSSKVMLQEYASHIGISHSAERRNKIKDSCKKYQLTNRGGLR